MKNITTSLTISKELQAKVKETGMTYKFLIKEGLKHVGERKDLNKLKAEVEREIERMDRRLQSTNTRLSEFILKTDGI